MKAWHFTNGALRDGRPLPAIGEWLRHDGPIEPCHSGLHASEKLIDALRFAPGGTLHRVTLRGEIMEHDGDKLVARERRIEWTLPSDVMEPLLRPFARWCALQVIHLWSAPDVVRRYLETGDESLRDAAWDAARDAARDAAGAAAWDAAWAAAWGAAGGAAWAAAWGAAWGAAWAAAWAAAGDAAWAAAGDAARDAQEQELLRLVRQARRKQLRESRAA